MTVQVIGLGFVGLSTVLALLKSGINVRGVDTDINILNSILSNGIAYKDHKYFELIEGTLQSGVFELANKTSFANVHIIAVQTLLYEDKSADMSFIDAAINSVLFFLRKEDLLIIESTLPLGVTEKIKNYIYSQRPELSGVMYIAYCPERIGTGDDINNVISNNRIIGGDDESIVVAKDFYKKFITGNVVCTSSRVAEMSKLAENSLRYIQIGFANELSIICQDFGIDIWNVINCINTHPITKILNPSTGVGGNCIPVGPCFLVSDFPDKTHLIQAAELTNIKKIHGCISIVIESIKTFIQKKAKRPIVAFMGISFKPNVGDLKNSSAMGIVESVIAQDICEYLIVEPYLLNHDKYELHNYYKASMLADIIVFLVAHDNFIIDFNTYDKTIIDFVGIKNK